MSDKDDMFHIFSTLLPVGAFRTDAQGRCLYVSPRWCDIAGLTPEQAAGAGWEQAVHPEDREKVAAAWYQAAQSNAAFRAEFRFMRPDGVITKVISQAIAEQDANGKTLTYVGTVTEVLKRD